MGLLVLLVLCFVGMIAYRLIVMASPTKGKKIEPYNDHKKAQLVIDIQEDFTGEAAKVPYKNSGRMISTANAVIEGASTKNISIIYICNEFNHFLDRVIAMLIFRGSAIKGASGTRIDERIVTKSGLNFSKHRADAFSNPALEKELAAQGVNELYLVGLDAAGCVDRTAKGALNRGYRVNVVEDSVVTRFEKKWDALLKQWDQLGIKLISSQEFLGKDL